MAATETSTRAAAALDDLYRHHVGEVYRYTYAVLGNHADAEDVTQTTFVNALRALERGEEPRNASAWLVAIAQNVVRQRWRQAASRPAEVELERDVPAVAVDDEIEVDELVRALQRIPPTQREALVMRELEGRSYKEIAELLGLSTAALETLLFRARRSLAEEIENLVTCQSAQLALSKQLDGRLGRKERRRLDDHLGECQDCARLAEMQKRQRRAFKGLAIIPIPVGLALFKGTPGASAATSLPTIGLASSGAGANGTGSAAGAARSGRRRRHGHRWRGCRRVARRSRAQGRGGRRHGHGRDRRGVQGRPGARRIGIFLCGRRRRPPVGEGERARRLRAPLAAPRSPPRRRARGSPRA